ncbi:SusC/RagA family TonB-linked outer membrane protein [Sunxiuqinia elliptica]
MKKKWMNGSGAIQWPLRRLLLIMRLSFVIILCSLLQVSASTFSQNTRFNVNLEDASITELFKDIKSQSEFTFVYNVDDIEELGTINCHFTEFTVEQILDNCLQGTNMTYKIRDKVIILVPREAGDTVLPLPADQAETKTIEGTVTDSKGEPLPGVSIVVKGTTIGITTDFDGNYSLKVPAETQVLVFSFVGMQSEEVALGDRTQISVVLKEENFGVEEVVVTALGIKREKKALGYAVTEVKSDDIANNKTINVISALQGKVAGLDISSVSGGPGASSRIVLRGISDLSGNNQPLVVVDGVPIDNGTLGSAGSGQYASGPDLGDGISSLNPDDVESVSVLKGPAASALYGSRATNGVLMITTKQGAKNSRIGVEISSQTNLELLNKFEDRQTEYGQGRNGLPPLDLSQARGTAQISWGGKLNPDLQVLGFDGKRYSYGLVNDGHNIEDFFRTGLSSQNTVSLNGGNDKGTFRLSYGRTDVADIVPHSGLQRNNFNFRGSWNFTPKFKADAKITYFTSKVENRPELADSPSNIGNTILGLAPNVDQSMLKENYQDAAGNYVDWNGNEYRINPYWVINRMKNESTKDRVTGFAHLNYALTDWLNVDFLSGTDLYSFEYQNYAPKTTPRLLTGALTQSRIITQETNHQLLLNFDKQINKDVRVSGNIGGNIRLYNNTTEVISATNANTGAIVSINDFKDRIPVVSHPKKEVNSLYGVARFSYKSWLYLDASLRNDWSSTLPASSRSYMYPSVSGSVIFSELMSSSTIDFLKVRGSWAQVGGDTDPYVLDKTYSNYPIAINGQNLMRITSDGVPNRNLKPTSTDAIEFGVNIAVFENRLNLDASYYNQKTSNQIMNLPLAATSGYNYAVINAGEVQNRGIEISINGTPIKTTDFSWNLTATFAKNENLIKKLHKDVNTLTLSTARWAGAEIRAIENQGYGTIVGKKQLRHNGQKVFNSNGYPIFGTELEVLGNGVYDWLGSLNSSFNYKNLTFKMLFDVKWGAELFSMTNQSAYINGASTASLEGREGWYRSEEERRAAGATEEEWTATGGYLGDGVILKYTDNGVEKIANQVDQNVEYTAVKNDIYVNPQVYWSRFQDGSPEPFIYDASYIKLRELALTYSIPSAWFDNKLDMTVSLIGRNLWVLYSKVPGGVDPESKYNNGNGVGFEYGSLPARRNIGFMLNLKF